MKLYTMLSEREEPGYAAYFVKELIDGLVSGCRFLYPGWSLPLLYESGVQFRLPPDHGAGVEYFALPPVVHQKGWGDCDQLVIWRLCELHAAGERGARCKTDWIGGAMHVRIRRGNGRTEDPARILLARQGQPVPPLLDEHR
jgi:hypothetical protein